MKITFITTVAHNVGDDFVREGLKYLLRQYFKGKHIVFSSVHKHSPITARHGFERLRYPRIFNRVDRMIPKGWTKDRIIDADIVVQSGAPVYWCHEGSNAHCYDNEWYTPLIRERFSRSGGAKLLNLAAGTCQRYHSDGTEFCESCNAYIEEFHAASEVTTLRDTLAKTVLSRVGIDAQVIPCSSIFAIDEHGLKNEGEEYVVVNYMPGGAHYTFGQKIDFEKWEATFKAFYYELKQKEKVIFSCHNEKEVKAARKIDPSAEIFYQKDDYLAYMKFYAKAKFGIMNRVHGAFLMASYEKPSIVIGNDTRARMAAEIGLKHYFVNDVDIDLLRNEYEFLKNGGDGFAERFRLIKEKAFADYMKAFSKL